MSTNIISQQKTYKLIELVDYYEVCNRAEGKSLKTINWYSANLKCFHRYLRSRHLADSIDNIDTKLLREYVLFLLKRCKFENHPYTPTQTDLLSAATVHGYVRTLRAFFPWLQTEEILEYNPAKELKPPKVVKKVITTLSDQEIVNIIDSFNQTSVSDVRNQVIFMLLIDTGLRIAELINLKSTDVKSLIRSSLTSSSLFMPNDHLPLRSSSRNS